MYPGIKKMNMTIVRQSYEASQLCLNCEEMKKIVAAIFAILGLAAVSDWIVFSTRYEKTFSDPDRFRLAYVHHLPGFIQPLFERPVLSTLLLLILFFLSGVLFYNEKQRVYKYAGFFALVMAFWQLFSLL